MANTRKGVKKLKHFQPSDFGHAAHQAQAPHGHAQDGAHQQKESSQGGGVRQHGRFADQAPKGPRRGQ